MAADETQVADAAPVEGWYCDQCGKRFPLPGTCDGTPEGQHESVQLKPLGPPPEVSPEDAITEPADAAAASADVDEPADATGSPAQAGEQQEAAVTADDPGDTADVAATDVTAPSSPEPSVLQKAKDALDRAAQAVADAASLVASKLEE